MIALLKRAIVHILDANSGVSVYSEEELDVTDASINSFITKHIEKVFEDASMRNAEFSENSGGRVYKGRKLFYYNVEIYCTTRL